MDLFSLFLRSRIWAEGGTGRVHYVGTNTFNLGTKSVWTPCFLHRPQPSPAPCSFPKFDVNTKNTTLLFGSYSAHIFTVVFSLLLELNTHSGCSDLLGLVRSESNEEKTSFYSKKLYSGECFWGTFRRRTDSVSVVLLRISAAPADCALGLMFLLLCRKHGVQRVHDPEKRHKWKREPLLKQWPLAIVKTTQCYKSNWCCRASHGWHRKNVVFSLINCSKTAWIKCRQILSRFGQF